jgi:hypothetical protein
MRCLPIVGAQLVVLILVVLACCASMHCPPCTTSQTPFFHVCGLWHCLTSHPPTDKETPSTISQARAQAQAGPGPAQAHFMGWAYDFNGPKPSEAQPKPGLLSPAQPSTTHSQQLLGIIIFILIATAVCNCIICITNYCNFCQKIYL